MFTADFGIIQRARGFARKDVCIYSTVLPSSWVHKNAELHGSVLVSVYTEQMQRLLRWTSQQGIRPGCRSGELMKCRLVKRLVWKECFIVEFATWENVQTNTTKPWTCFSCNSSGDKANMLLTVPLSFDTQYSRCNGLVQRLEALERSTNAVPCWNLTQFGSSLEFFGTSW